MAFGVTLISVVNLLEVPTVRTRRKVWMTGPLTLLRNLQRELFIVRGPGTTEVGRASTLTVTIALLVPCKCPSCVIPLPGERLRWTNLLRAGGATLCLSYRELGIKFPKWSTLSNLDRCDSGRLKCGATKALEFRPCWTRFRLNNILRVPCVAMWETFSNLSRSCLDGTVRLVPYRLVRTVVLRPCVSRRHNGAGRELLGCRVRTLPTQVALDVDAGPPLFGRGMKINIIRTLR